MKARSCVLGTATGHAAVYAGAGAGGKPAALGDLFGGEASPYNAPLWYYILAEAAVLGNGRRLGPVGGTIVAEVLVGLLRRSEGSILRTDNWEPSLPSAEPGTFTLNDLLRFAGVLN